MSIFSWISNGLRSIFSGADHSADDSFMSDINPANGLPMMGDLDVEGNPYGVDLNDNAMDVGFNNDLFADDFMNHDFDDRF